MGTMWVHSFAPAFVCAHLEVRIHCVALPSIAVELHLQLHSVGTRLQHMHVAAVHASDGFQ